MTRRAPGAGKGLSKGSPFCLLALAAVLAQAEPAPHTTTPHTTTQHTITLHARDGSALAIGQLLLAPRAEGGSTFRLRLDGAVFVDHFLSMREFKCLPGDGEILCHVPYPHAQPGTLADGDTAWLEHALLFMFKKPADYGARLWNGVYWQLQRTGRGWTGTPQAVDLNLIGAPPARPGPPFRPALRESMPEGARWFVRMSIE